MSRARAKITQPFSLPLSFSRENGRAVNNNKRSERGVFCFMTKKKRETRAKLFQELERFETNAGVACGFLVGADGALLVALHVQDESEIEVRLCVLWVRPGGAQIGLFREHELRAALVEHAQVEVWRRV